MCKLKSDFFPWSCGSTYHSFPYFLFLSPKLRMQSLRYGTMCSPYVEVEIILLHSKFTQEPINYKPLSLRVSEWEKHMCFIHDFKWSAISMWHSATSGILKYGGMHLINFHLISSHLIWSELFFIHLVISDLIWSYPMPFDLIWQNIIQSNLILFYLISSHLISSNHIWFNLLQSYGIWLYQIL